MAEVARLSRPGARLAGFTAAGHARRPGQGGLEVVKSPGFGTKREMITGRFAGPPWPVGGAPWHRLPRAPDVAGRVVIAGVAGAALAAALGGVKSTPVIIGGDGWRRCVVGAAGPGDAAAQSRKKPERGL